MVNCQWSMVKGLRLMVNGQWSMVNKKNSAYPVDKQGSVFLFSQINSIFSQKARCYFLISEIVFLASETTT